MRRSLFLITLFSCLLSSITSYASDITKDINSVKRDPMYIYAEATMKNLDEALSGAQAILEMKVGEWVRSQQTEGNVEVCIVKAKQHCIHLETRRGDFYRAFVYVRKTDIMPVADKSEIAVFEVNPVSTSGQVQNASGIVISEEAPIEEKKFIAPKLSDEEQQMKLVKRFDDIEPYIKKLKSEWKLKNFGKYATIPAEEDCYMFVYDKSGNIPALLCRKDNLQYNLNTLMEDNIKNYKNCGAIWFQLK